MATTVRASDDIDVLDLSFRAYNALRRNNVRTVGDLLSLSDVEILRFRNIGESSLRDLRARLAAHGLSMQVAPSPPPDPALVAEAAWIGRQLDALSEDDRAHPTNYLGTRATDVSSVQRRRFAWRMFRWATGHEEKWPNMKEKGAAFDVYPLPGSVELHLDGLNRLAHEELDA
jgi:hypothetical protein